MIVQDRDDLVGATHRFAELFSTVEPQLLRSMDLLRPQCSNGYRFANSNCWLNVLRWTIKLQCNSKFVVLL